jgi:hypothetical protein
VPPPPNDLLATDPSGLGPIAAQWDGLAIDTKWIIDTFARQSELRADRGAERPVEDTG